jgi:hypothetical protein
MNLTLLEKTAIENLAMNLFSDLRKLAPHLNRWESLKKDERNAWRTKARSLLREYENE